METIENIFKSIYDSYRDRIKSPLVGSFILTFLLWNWKTIPILLYSDWPMHCRIEWIESNYLNFSQKWYNYLIPFIISLFYVMALPYVNLEIEKVLARYSKTKLDKKNAAKLASYDQMEEEAKKERKVADAKAGTSEIITLQSKIESLQEELKDLTDRNKLDEQRWSERSTISLEKENDLNKSVDNLSKENNTLKNRINQLIKQQMQKDEEDYNRLQDPDIFELAKKTLKNTTELEIKALVNLFGTGNESKTHIRSRIDKVFLNRLTDLGLVQITDELITTTALGKFILQLIQHDLA